jgi:transglutaminase-like putative cysteine protease
MAYEGSNPSLRTMNTQTRIKSLYFNVLEHLGLVFYLKSETYRVTYTVTLKNQSQDTKNNRLIIPVPSHTKTQTISNIHTSYKALEKTDKLYGNVYHEVPVLLAPHQERIFTISYIANIQPHTTHIPKNSDSTKIQTPYLSANAYINPDLEQIKKVAETISGQTKSFRNRLKKINEYVISTLSYGGKYTGLYSVHDALEKPEVDCGGFDALFVSLCVAVGIPARIVSGFWLGYDKNEMHAWVEILSRNKARNNPTGDEWIPADPSVEQLRRQARTRHLGKLGSIGSDRLILSYGSDIPLEVQGKTIHVDILQHPSLIEDSNPKTISVHTTVSSQRL